LEVSMVKCRGGSDDKGGATRCLALASAAVAFVVLASAAMAQLVANPQVGSVGRGAQVFAQCANCHSLEPDRNLAGPTLHGLFGRKAGSQPGYQYSRAMRRAKLIWSEDTLSMYLAAPQKVVPQDAAASACRVRDPTELGDLLAYLRAANR
jgi:cytochrome c